MMSLLQTQRRMKAAWNRSARFSRLSFLYLCFCITFQPSYLLSSLYVSSHNGYQRPTTRPLCLQPRVGRPNCKRKTFPDAFSVILKVEDVPWERPKYRVGFSEHSLFLGYVTISNTTNQVSA